MTGSVNKKRSVSGSRKSTARSTSLAASRGTKPVAPVASKSSVLLFLTGTAFGKFLLGLLLFIVVIGLDFLFTFNLMDRFFIAIGLELLLLVIIGWIRFVIRGKNGDEA